MKNPVGKLVIIIMLVVALLQLATGCTPLDFVKAIVPSKSGINAEAQVGDRENTATLGGDSDKQNLTIDETKGNVAVTNNQTKQRTTTRIDRADTVKISNAPVWIIVLLVLGWILPTPHTLWRKASQLITKRKG